MNAPEVAHHQQTLAGMYAEMEYSIPLKLAMTITRLTTMDAQIVPLMMITRAHEQPLPRQTHVRINVATDFSIPWGPILRPVMMPT